LIRQGTYLLASDLDGTLIPPAEVQDGGGIQELTHALEGRSDVVLAYVTGRHLELSLAGVALHSLPIPDVLVCDVGTSVFLRETAHFVPDARYRERMMSALGASDLSAVRERLADVEGIVLQEEEKQAEFKLSYYLDAGERGEQRAERVGQLARDTLDGVNVVHSVDTVAGRGLLDILPAGVAKDTALAYLQELLGLTSDHVTFAGDSGNDFAALLSGFNAVLVGNASAELKDSVKAEARARDLAERVYVARGSYARGVVEGARRFGVF